MRPNDGILITRDVTGVIKQLAAVSISLRHPETRARYGRIRRRRTYFDARQETRAFKSLNSSLTYERRLNRRFNRPELSFLKRDHEISAAVQSSSSVLASTRERVDNFLHAFTRATASGNYPTSTLRESTTRDSERAYLEFANFRASMRDREA